MTQDFLSKVEEEDSENILNLFYFEAQIMPHLNFPSQCSTNYLATRAFDSRAEEVGNRLLRFVENGGFREDGSLDFKKGGCYELEFEDDKASTVKHISGATVTLPSHVLITQEFTLHDNHMDHLARVELKPSMFALWTFFDDSHPFVKLIIKEKKAQTLVDHAIKAEQAAVAAESSRAANTVQQNPRVLQPVQNKKASENLQKAREQLKARAADKQKKRTIKL